MLLFIMIICISFSIVYFIFCFLLLFLFLHFIKTFILMQCIRSYCCCCWFFLFFLTSSFLYIVFIIINFVLLTTFFFFSFHWYSILSFVYIQMVKCLCEWVCVCLRLCIRCYEDTVCVCVCVYSIHCWKCFFNHSLLMFAFFFLYSNLSKHTHRTGTETHNNKDKVCSLNSAEVIAIIIIRITITINNWK